MIYFLTYPLVFTVLRFLMRLLGRLRSSGEYNVPRSGGVIYCPNHVSDSDPVAVFVTVPRRAWYIGKSELFEIPILGKFFGSFRGIPITRDSADRAALRRAENCLKRGEPLVIFPEGRCSEAGTLQRLQPGAALLAVRTGSPIIPIGLEQTNSLLPYRSLVPRPSRKPVTVTYGPPIHPKDFAHLKRGAAIEAITRKIGEELARMTGQEPPSGE